MFTVEQAYDILITHATEYGTPSTTSLPLHQARGRVLAENMYAQMDIPPADNSAMDGYAFCAADLASGKMSLPISQRIAAGEAPQPLVAGTAARIFTGALIPPGADTVIMQELTELDAEQTQVTFTRTVPTGNAVRRQGSDIACGQEVLLAGERLGAGGLGLLASLGQPEVSVYQSIRVASLLTGSELVEPGQPLSVGKIYNSNATLLQQLLAPLPVSHTSFGCIADQLDATVQALQQAAEGADVVITTGGVSVGEEDHVKQAITRIGVLETWKIAIKPGKPFAFGKIRRTDGSFALFIGLPGNPVSAFVTFAILVRPFLLKLCGMHGLLPKATPMRADFDWLQPDKRREYLRVRVNAEGGLSLFPNQQSGVLSSIHWADGLLDNPPEQKIHAGDFVAFYPWSALSIF